MDEKTIKDLIDLVLNAAPFLWETVIRQNYLYVVLNVVWGIAFMVGGIVSVKMVNKASADWDSFDNGLWKYLWITASALLFLFVAIEVSMVISRLVNPNYYAIQELLNLVR